jgi:hypothetical protein
LPHLFREVEDVYRFLPLVDITDIIEDIDTDITIAQHWFFMSPGKEQHLSRETATGKSIQPLPFSRLPEADDFDHGMLFIGLAERLGPIQWIQVQ